MKYETYDLRCEMDCTSSRDYGVAHRSVPAQHVKPDCTKYSGSPVYKLIDHRPQNSVIHYSNIDVCEGGQTLVLQAVKF